MRILGLLLVILFLVSTASGQGCTYHNNYATYAVATMDPTTGYVSETVTLTGSMTPPNCAMIGATHTPKLEAVLNGSYGGWYTAPGGSPSSYFNSSHTWTFNWDIDCATSNDACSLALLGDVVCSAAGTLFGNGPGGIANWIGERAITLSENTNVPYQINGWYITSDCTTASSPPDWNPGAYYELNGSPAPYYPYIT
jgi:hypothetical protein